MSEFRFSLGSSKPTSLGSNTSYRDAGMPVRLRWKNSTVVVNRLLRNAASIPILAISARIQDNVVTGIPLGCVPTIYAPSITEEATFTQSPSAFLYLL